MHQTKFTDAILVEAFALGNLFIPFKPMGNLGETTKVVSFLSLPQSTVRRSEVLTFRTAKYIDCETKILARSNPTICG